MRRARRRTASKGWPEISAPRGSPPSRAESSWRQPRSRSWPPTSWSSKRRSIKPERASEWSREIVYRSSVMRTVAIVDDMLPNALLLKGYMKQIEGIEAVTFTDPNDALAKCTEHVPDLVLLDYHMPQMNGVEFLGKFRAI